MGRTQDFTYRMDRSENMVMASGAAYVKGITAMLFGLQPGSDPYNPEMGLFLPGKRFRAGSNGVRDYEYENQIAYQFSRYTKIQATSIIAFQKDGRYIVSFSAVFDDSIYDMRITSEPNSLNVLIQERS